MLRFNFIETSVRRSRPSVERAFFTHAHVHVHAHTHALLATFATATLKEGDSVSQVTHGRVTVACTCALPDPGADGICEDMLDNSENTLSNILDDDLGCDCADNVRVQAGNNDTYTHACPICEASSA